MSKTPNKSIESDDEEIAENDRDQKGRDREIEGERLPQSNRVKSTEDEMENDDADKVDDEGELEPDDTETNV